MALLMGVCHSILISGQLNNSNTIEIRLPFDDVKSNLWQISINEISIEYNSECNFLSSVCTNFVTDISFNESNQIINYQPILNQILFKGNRNDKEVLKFERSWLYVNNAQEILKLHFFLLANGKISKLSTLPINCNVYATVLLQRVK